MQIAKRQYIASQFSGAALWSWLTVSAAGWNGIRVPSGARLDNVLRENIVGLDCGQDEGDSDRNQ
jgi:hypothetical protein